MSNEYELVTAKTYEEAIEKSKYFVGQRAEVVKVNPVANNNGTWSVFPEYRLMESKKDGTNELPGR